jgi:hypothetical protein
MDGEQPTGNSNVVAGNASVALPGDAWRESTDREQTTRNHEVHSNFEAEVKRAGLKANLDQIEVFINPVRRRELVARRDLGLRKLPFFSRREDTVTNVDAGSVRTEVLGLTPGGTITLTIPRDSAESGLNKTWNQSSNGRDIKEEETEDNGSDIVELEHWNIPIEIRLPPGTVQNMDRDRRRSGDSGINDWSSRNGHDNPVKYEPKIHVRGDRQRVLERAENLLKGLGNRIKKSEASPLPGPVNEEAGVRFSEPELETTDDERDFAKYLKNPHLRYQQEKEKGDVKYRTDPPENGDSEPRYEQETDKDDVKYGIEPINGEPDLRYELEENEKKDIEYGIDGVNGEMDADRGFEEAERKAEEADWKSQEEPDEIARKETKEHKSMIPVRTMKVKSDVSFL